mmetsp:Transcript_2099/g.3524  ORF Transcript_2099/g.3524 Transcript_2099/m.3524 type:complete len:361 (+) Transcript_2099:993-2075(+)
MERIVGWAQSSFPAKHRLEGRTASIVLVGKGQSIVPELTTLRWLPPLLLHVAVGPENIFFDRLLNDFLASSNLLQKPCGHLSGEVGSLNRLLLQVGVALLGKRTGTHGDRCRGEDDVLDGLGQSHKRVVRSNSPLALLEIAEESLLRIAFFIPVALLHGLCFLHPVRGVVELFHPLLQLVDGVLGHLHRHDDRLNEAVDLDRLGDDPIQQAVAAPHVLVVDEDLVLNPVPLEGDVGRRRGGADGLAHAQPPRVSGPLGRRGGRIAGAVADEEGVALDPARPGRRLGAVADGPAVLEAGGLGPDGLGQLGQLGTRRVRGVGLEFFPYLRGEEGDPLRGGDEGGLGRHGGGVQEVPVGTGSS